MITLVTGNPGHGKSYTAVRLIDESVHKGIPVATNVPLRSDWPEVMAKRHTLLGGKKAVARKAERYRRLVLVTNDLGELLRVRIAGKGEGRGRIVLDEAHRWMNTRAWDQAPGLSRQDAIAARLAVVGYISAHRHYGVDVWLLSQAETNIDAQVRNLYEFHCELRNFRRLPLFGSLFRINLFLAVTRWNDRARTKAGISMYGLSRSLARLYDTHALEQLDWPADAIVLPRPGTPALLTEIPAGRDGEASGASPRLAPPLPPPEGTTDPADEHSAALG